MKNVFLVGALALFTTGFSTVHAAEASKRVEAWPFLKKTDFAIPPAAVPFQPPAVAKAISRALFPAPVRPMHTWEIARHTFATMPIVRPNEAIDFKLSVQAPDPAIDYKMAFVGAASK